MATGVLQCPLLAFFEPSNSAITLKSSAVARAVLCRGAVPRQKDDLKPAALLIDAVVDSSSYD
jgi:hypothetical protein